MGMAIKPPTRVRSDVGGRWWVEDAEGRAVTGWGHVTQTEEEAQMISDALNQYCETEGWRSVVADALQKQVTALQKENELLWAWIRLVRETVYLEGDHDEVGREVTRLVIERIPERATADG